VTSHAYSECYETRFIFNGGHAGSMTDIMLFNLLPEGSHKLSLKFKFSKFPTGSRHIVMRYL
jgi:hypothetical protein